MRTHLFCTNHVKTRLLAALFAALVAGTFGCSGDGDGTSTGGDEKNDTSGTVDDGGGQADAGVTDSVSGGDSGAVTDAGGSATDAGGSSTDAGGSGADAGPADIPPEDVPPVKVCSKGQVKCEGAKLATCGIQEDGWILSNCFPGNTCSNGKCVPVNNNLIVVFDSSGSMTAKVNLGCWCGSGCTKDKKTCPAFLCKGTSPTGCTQKPCSNLSWPSCDPSKGCSRMDISKMVFSAALDKINANTTRMAMFRFPQKIKYTSSTFKSCNSGFYYGQSFISGETSPGPKDQEFVDGNSNWFWPSLNETLCVRFPPDDTYPTKQKMKKWMDGTESMQQLGTCGNPSTICQPWAGCAGACCAGKCFVHTDPELRPTGGTPIGKTLFYVGEYLRNKVVIDGKKCKTDADCDNVNYQCKKGVCKDPARSCRDTVVVLFTDGGQGNTPSKYFAPWVQAKRLGMGLACQSNKDCVGGAKCKDLINDKTQMTMGKYCQSEFEDAGGIDTYCTKTNKPCLSGVTDPTKELYCAGQCVKHPQNILTGKAKDFKNNVLRSPDGKPFGVRVHVVDISAQPNITNSMNLAMSGNGSLLGADAADPDTFLQKLNQVFDIKNLKVCGADF